uniref:Endonuclease/exonuclease/phosphatase domain-containing protein n=1 Tax=viral metagenome TaxID=1070528 RepID=A0A6C0HSE1_9ZZZZ
MSKVICWNVEDFEMLSKNYTSDLYQNLDYDIFLIQEWKHIGIEDEQGGAFLKGLNNEHGGKYAIVFVDRVAVIYDSSKSLC